MKKRKHFNRSKKIKPLLVGSYYSFDVRDPLGEMPAITNTGYGHKNPISAIMMKQSIKGLHAIFDNQKLKWRSKIVVEFNSGSEIYERHAELVWVGLLRDCEGKYQEAIESIFDKSKMNHYVICHIKAEVVGVDKVTDSDFTIEKCDAA